MESAWKQEFALHEAEALVPLPALTAWMDAGAQLHLARMELELQGARDPAHAARPHLIFAYKKVQRAICGRRAAACPSMA